MCGLPAQAGHERTKGSVQTRTEERPHPWSVTILGCSSAYLLAGAIITEKIFNWQGLGPAPARGRHRGADGLSSRPGWRKLTDKHRHIYSGKHTYGSRLSAARSANKALLSPPTAQVCICPALRSRRYLFFAARRSFCAVRCDTRCAASHKSMNVMQPPSASSIGLGRTGSDVMYFRGSFGVHASHRSRDLGGGSPGSIFGTLARLDLRGGFTRRLH